MRPGIPLIQQVFRSSRRGQRRVFRPFFFPGHVVPGMDLRLPLLFAALLFGTAHAQTCVSDEACQDGSWCNGLERCMGNPPRPMCSDKKVCDEVGKRCLTSKRWTSC